MYVYYVHYSLLQDSEAKSRWFAPSTGETAYYNVKATFDFELN